MLSFLNQNSGAFTVIFSGVVAISTAVYAILTWRLTSETRKMREAQTTPNVLVTVESGAGNFRNLYLVVKNVGLAPAYDIKFTTSPDFLIVKDYSLSMVGFVKNGLGILAPGQEIKTFLYSPSLDKSKSQIDAVLNIEIVYKGVDEKQIKQNYQINLSQFKRILSVTTRSSYDNDLLSRIQDIARAIERIGNKG